MTCPYCGCDPDRKGFEQGACTCRCHWGIESLEAPKAERFVELDAEELRGTR
jgi:hypothetical protein